jgi:hypothetical protein
MKPETSRSEITNWITDTLEKLERRGLLHDPSSEACGIIMAHWPAPLWSIDLGMPSPKESKALKTELEKRRATYYDEF